MQDALRSLQDHYRLVSRVDMQVHSQCQYDVGDYHGKAASDVVRLRRISGALSGCLLALSLVTLTHEHYRVTASTLRAVTRASSL